MQSTDWFHFSLAKVKAVTIVWALCIFPTLSFCADTDVRPNLSIPVTSNFEIKTDWFDPTRCAGSKLEKFYFEIDGNPFAVAKDEFAKGILGNVELRNGKNAGEFLLDLPLNSGCSDSPVSLSQVVLHANSETLHKKFMMKFMAGETGPLPRTTIYIQHLGKKGRCKKTKVERLSLCQGSKTQNNQKITIIFLVVHEKTGGVLLSKTGLPKHAHCEGISAMHCRIPVRISKNIEARAALKDIANITPSLIEKVMRELEFAVKSISVTQ